MSDVLPSSTVVLLRDGEHGLETWMMRRHRNSRFMPSLWVFPGGRVDEADLMSEVLNPADTRPDGFGFTAEESIRRQVAAIRETYEESGVWLGQCPLKDGARDALLHGATLSSVVLGPVSFESIVPWSRWRTPVGRPRRYDAAFYVAAAPQGVTSLAGEEMEEGQWVDVRETLRQGGRPLAPPTWATLKQLALCDDLRAVMTRAGTRNLRLVMPVRLDGPELQFALPGHPRHPMPAREDLPWGAVWQDGRWEDLQNPV
ncbi:MAG: NUDIX hydrolase [Myxococcota bacterium]